MAMADGMTFDAPTGALPTTEVIWTDPSPSTAVALEKEFRLLLSNSMAERYHQSAESQANVRMVHVDNDATNAKAAASNSVSGSHPIRCNAIYRASGNVGMSAPARSTRKPLSGMLTCLINSKHCCPASGIDAAALTMVATSDQPSTSASCPSSA